MFTRHLEHLLTRYCDGDLTVADKQRVDAHLVSCRRCRAALDEIQFSDRLVRQLNTVSAPASLWNSIDAALSESRPGSPRSWIPGYVFACVLILAVGAGAYLWTRDPAPRPWEVAHTMGGARRMAAGEWVETDNSSKARIIVGRLGTVDVAPGTRVQLGQVRDSEYRLALAHGTISAEITAPPRLFIVDTPASAVVDLGCAYTVTVAEDGAGELRMTTGWAALEFNGQESLVPAGAICRTKRGSGPGTPYFADASAAFKQSVDDFDVGANRRQALEVILREARVRDTLTLWHLLSRVDASDRERVYDTIAAYAPPPARAPRDRILALDADALRRWREELAWKW